MSSTVLCEVTNRIVTLTIHRPESLNALNSTVLKDLGERLNELETLGSKNEISAIIVCGAGEKAFVAGADIKEMQGLKPEQARIFAETGQKVFRRLEVLPTPVIAAVHGFALGGGCELALACDFIYASQTAKFGLPEVSLGLIPGFGGTQRLSRAVGVQRARELIFSGQMLSAEEALQIGLVNKILPGKAELMAEAQKICTVIAERGPMAVKDAKRAILEGLPMDIDSGLELERDLFADLFGYQDVTEGLAAFVEKRKPQFRKGV